MNEQVLPEAGVIFDILRLDIIEATLEETIVEAGNVVLAQNGVSIIIIHSFWIPYTNIANEGVLSEVFGSLLDVGGVSDASVVFA